jgi:putative flippase GtrA
MLFLAVGALNTAFGLAVYSVFIHFFGIIWLAVLCGMIAGVVFNFFTLGGVVFRRLEGRRFIRFALVYVFIFVVNTAALYGLGRGTDQLLLLQVALAAPLALLSYFLQSRFVFKD